MALPLASKPTLVPCPVCNEFVAEHNLKRHKNRVHNPERMAREKVDAERRSLAVVVKRHRLEEALRLRAEISCPVCKLTIQIGHIKSHFGNIHAAPAPAHLLSLLGEAPPQDKFRSDRDRERYWRAVDGASAEPPSEDLFDRTKVVQGCAYGLGKSRKH